MGQGFHRCLQIKFIEYKLISFSVPTTKIIFHRLIVNCRSQDVETHLWFPQTTVKSRKPTTLILHAHMTCKMRMIMTIYMYEGQWWQHVMIMSLAHLMVSPVTRIRVFGTRTQWWHRIWHQRCRRPARVFKTVSLKVQATNWNVPPGWFFKAPRINFSEKPNPLQSHVWVFRELESWNTAWITSEDGAHPGFVS